MLKNQVHKRNKNKVKTRNEIKKISKTSSKFDFTGDILLENVSYTYAPKTPFEFKALDQVTLNFEKEKITCIIGTTGSGKSTLIQLTNGLLISETGRTIIGNYQILAKQKKIPDVKELRKQIGLVFQFPEYQLFQETVEKDIAFGPIHLGENRNFVLAQVPNLLKLVNLPSELLNRSPFELSGGQKRRVAIAGILAMNGSTLVLDEPTGGLDPEGEEEFMNLFLKLNKKHHKRIIMVTHNMDQVLRIADEVIVMSKGKVVTKGTPFEIFSNEQLLTKIEIEPPKIYQLLYKLRDRGLDLTAHEIRNIEDFVGFYQKKMPINK